VHLETSSETEGPTSTGVGSINIPTVDTGMLLLITQALEKFNDIQREKSSSHFLDGRGTREESDKREE